MPQVYDEEGPLYVVSPKHVTLTLHNVKVELPGPASQFRTVRVSGDPGRGPLAPAHQLALAVLKGDTGAALLLADLVQEQHTGSRSELQAEVAKRVTLAIEKEREKCAQIADRVALMESAASGPGDLPRRLAYVAGEIAQTIRCQKAQ